jgi:hypothetical protein
MFHATIGPIQTVRELSRGGTGRSFLPVRRLDRQVAIKAIPDGGFVMIERTPWQQQLRAIHVILS